ncbi:MAG: HAD-IA family hydrolase [Gammaproteobacteria bacterium]|nr:HAD-IA family hydrolase [Gammaproteobacteria bacterium]
MKIKLITFDLDNTVWEEREVLLRATRETNTWIAEHVPAYASLAAERYWAIRQELIRDRPEVLYDVSALRRLLVARCFIEIGETAHEAARLSEAAFEVFIHWRCQVQPYPEAEALLESLSKSYIVASITNGNSDVTRTSLNQYFSFNLNAAEVRAAKPAPLIFERALELANVADAACAIHVGDNPRDDIEGAAGIGMKTIWIDHKRVNELAAATVIVNDLEEVAEAIHTIETSA